MYASNESSSMNNYPVVVALLGVVPDEVNALVWKFVGFRSRVAKEIHERKQSCLRLYSTQDQEALFPRLLKAGAKWDLDMIITTARNRLRRMRKITERRSEFAKLRPWLRRYLIARFKFTLFPNNQTNMSFLDAQIVELGMRYGVRGW